MLEQIIPLMDTYSVPALLIRQLDSRLNEIARDGGMLLIASSISCMSALYEKFQPTEQPGICRLFVVYFSEFLDFGVNIWCNRIGGKSYIFFICI